MRAIRSANTRPELLVRKILHAAGFRFRLHVTGLPGKPDIVLPKHRTVIFVHGCFWHGHSCRYFKLPQTRQDFWLAKITANQTRDRIVSEKLTALGWDVILIWECATRTSGPGLPEVVRRVTDCIAGRAVRPDHCVTVISCLPSPLP